MRLSYKSVGGCPVPSSHYFPFPRWHETPLQLFPVMALYRLRLTYRFAECEKKNTH